MRKIKFRKDHKNDAGIIPVYLAKRTGQMVSFFCPYCLTEHKHGIPPGMEPKPFLAEHRVQHCTTSPKAHDHGYYFFYAD